MLCCAVLCNSGSRAGQTSQHLDSIFTGGFLGRKSDIADGSLRYEEFRSFNNIIGEYYVAPRFLTRVAMHMAKNYLWKHLRGVKVPLILGIWGALPPSARGSVSAPCQSFSGWVQPRGAVLKSRRRQRCVGHFQSCSELLSSVVAAAGVLWVAASCPLSSFP